MLFTAFRPPKRSEKSKSHNLRAKPRDLQLSGPFVEMFFDRA
jgi:hypothetical protein